MELTSKTFVDTVRRIAEEDPDRTYDKYRGMDHTSTCTYSPDPYNPKGCIVGAAITQLGFEILEEWDLGENASEVIEDILGDFDKPGIIHPEELNWLDEVQRAQDNGSTWKRAVEKADELHLVDAQDLA